MSLSAIVLYNVRGQVLLKKDYRGDIDNDLIEKFLALIEEKEEKGEFCPIVYTAKCSYAYLQHQNIYVVSISKKNVNITMTLKFLVTLVEVMRKYFNELEEESIKDNFVMVYELLDEMLDFGYPQVTDTNILQEYITQEGHKLEIQPRIPMAVTNAVSWRSEGIKYSSNELFLDVIESINLLANANGNVLRSMVHGTIKMKVFLSGMPELRLGLNDKILFECIGHEKSTSIELEDVKFHQCVKLSKFENDRTISFIPPDGEFELMSYRLNKTKFPILVESVIERHAHSRVEYIIKASSQCKFNVRAKNVKIVVPVPSDADSPVFKTTTGRVEYRPEENVMLWYIKEFPGKKEYVMRAHFSLPSVTGENVVDKPPINVKFEIPNFTASDIHVRYLKVMEKSGYKAKLWLRYISKNGDYQFRTN